MPDLEAYEALTQIASAQFTIAEAAWVAGHRRAQERIDATRIVPISILSLYTFLTRPCNAIFEREQARIIAQYDAAVALLEGGAVPIPD